jgi:hypothetical protein
VKTTTMVMRCRVWQHMGESSKVVWRRVAWNIATVSSLSDFTIPPSRVGGIRFRYVIGARLNRIACVRRYG